LIAFLKALDMTLVSLNQAFYTSVLPDHMNSTECCQITGYDGFGPNLERDLLTLEDPSSVPITQNIAKLYDTCTEHINKCKSETNMAWHYVNAALLDYVAKLVSGNATVVHLAQYDEEAQKYIDHWRAVKVPQTLDTALVAKLASQFEVNAKSYSYIIGEKQWLQRVFYNLKRFYQKMASRKRHAPDTLTAA
jgi:hypothetical protein